jgi:predicted GNAT family acetyltransferase
MASAWVAGETAIGLRVNLDNTNADSLYHSVGFRDWPTLDA